MFRLISTKLPPATCLIIGTCVVCAISMGLEFTGTDTQKIIEYGGNFAPFSMDHEPWRILASIFLHGSFVHLLLNMLALYTLGRSIEPVTGPVFFLLLFVVSGIAGNLVSLYWNLFNISVGASGAIFGLFGFDLVLTITNLKSRQEDLSGTLLTAGIYVALILLIGLVFPFDNAAHIGGLTAGILVGILVNMTAYRKRVLIFGAIPVLLAIFFTLPRFQVYHYRHFNTLRETDDFTSDKIVNFSTDAEAIKGYEEIKSAYDSVTALFSDSLGEIPRSVQQDRNILRNYATSRSRETAYKIRLLREHTYRYLDSLEIIPQGLEKPLNHPLAFGTSAEQKEDSPPEIVRVWYDEDWKETRNFRNAMYYRLGYKDSLGRWHGRVEDFYRNGGIQMKGYYESGLRNGVFRYYSQDSTYTACGKYDNEIRTGFWEFFHDNGRLAEIRNFTDHNYLLSAWDRTGKQLVRDGNGEVIELYSNEVIRTYTPYRNGLVEGTAYGNYGNGTLKYREVYQKGMLVQGRSYAENSTNTYDLSTYFPHPVGGMENFEKYVHSRTSQTELSGRVKLLFTCPPSGEIYDIRIWESASPVHDSTAIAILKDGPEWNPAREHGLEPYTSEGSVTISFNQ